MSVLQKTGSVKKRNPPDLAVIVAHPSLMAEPVGRVRQVEIKKWGGVSRDPERTSSSLDSRV